MCRVQVKDVKKVKMVKDEDKMVKRVLSCPSALSAQSAKPMPKVQPENLKLSIVP